MRPALSPRGDAELEKEALRDALAVVTGLTAREIAARLGISASLLYAYLDPLRPHHPGPDRLRELADLYRAEGERLLATAGHLERVALAADRVAG